LPRDDDRDLNGARHLIENFFARIEQFRAIAIRYEKPRETCWPLPSLSPASFGLIDDRPAGLSGDLQPS
jgi:hypothetical protein